MRTSLVLVIAAVTALVGCLDMDGFLADERAVDAYALPGNTIPEALIEPVTFESDGHALHGFWVASNGGRPGMTLMYFHGNKHHLDEYWDRVMALHDLGVNVFIFDYSGFGRSEGSFSESAMLLDARAALDFVVQRPDVSVDSIGFYGFSLGNVASIHLAAEVGDPLFLIAESPFASATSLVQGAVNLALPAGWLTTATFDNAARIERIRTPFLLLHGANDDFVRYRDNGRIVFERAPEPKALVLVSDAGHSTIPQTMGPEAYRAAIGDWISRTAEYRASGP